MSKKTDHYEVLEQSRSAAVRAAANLFDGLSKAKQLRKRAAASIQSERVLSDKDAQGGESEDFLFDMLRLHATYLNEVARLGERYRGFAYRALENLYRASQPSRSGFGKRTDDELVFADPKFGSTGAWQHSLVVHNDADPEVSTIELDFPCVTNAETGDVKAPLAVLDAGAALQTTLAGSRARVQVDVTFGIPKAVMLRADAAIFAGRKLDDYLYVRLRLPANQVRERRIPLRLDGRDYDALMKRLEP